MQPLPSHGIKKMGENGPIVAVDRVTGSGCMDCQPRRYAGEGPKPLDSHLSQGPSRCL